MDSTNCHAYEACRDYSARDQKPADRADGSLLCGRCLAHAEWVIDKLDFDYLDLENFLPKPISSGLDGQPRGGKSQPTPIREDVDELQREIVALACLAHRIVATYDGLTDPPGGRAGPRLQRAVAVVRPRLALMARLESGVEILVRLGRAHHRVRSLIGLTRRTTRLAGDCSGCSASYLLRDEPRFAGDPLMVRCGSCERTWTNEEYETYVGLHLGLTR